MPQTRCGARDTSSARAHPRMHVTTACRPPRGIGLAIGRYMARPSSVQWVPQRKKTAIQRGDAEDWRLAADGRRIAGHKCIAPAGLCCAAARLEQAASHKERLVGRTGEGDYEVAPRPIWARARIWMFIRTSFTVPAKPDPSLRMISKRLPASCACGASGSSWISRRFRLPRPQPWLGAGRSSPRRSC